jgi:AbrB family looped-hinge helix DNA binding protein
MSNLLDTTKIQERGTVTIPQSVRDKLGIKKGSTVAFVETDDGRVEIRVIEADVIAALDELGEALKAKGVTMNEWLAASRKSRKRAFDKLYPGL